MSQHRNNSTARSRDFGLRGSGAGKGDAPRHTVNDEWCRNFNLALYGAIWSEPIRGEKCEGFVQVSATRQRKVYR